MDPEEKIEGQEAETAGEQTPGSNAEGDGEQAEGTQEAEGSEGTVVADGAEAEEGAEGSEKREPLFDEKQQAVFDERLGKEVGKRKALEEQVDTLKAQAQVATEEAVRAVGVHPRYLGAGEAELIKRANELEQKERTLTADIDAALEAQDAEKGKKARAELVSVQQELRRVAGVANGAYDKAIKQQVADMELGRQVRLERKAAAKKVAAAGKGKAKVPGAAGAVAPTANARPIASGAPKRGMSVDRFKKAGGTMEAAERELEELVR